MRKFVVIDRHGNELTAAAESIVALSKQEDVMRMAPCQLLEADLKSGFYLMEDGALIRLTVPVEIETPEGRAIEPPPTRPGAPDRGFNPYSPRNPVEAIAALGELRLHLFNCGNDKTPPNDLQQEFYRLGAYIDGVITALGKGRMPEAVPENEHFLPGQPRHGMRWSKEEDKELEQKWESGARVMDDVAYVPALAKHHGRTVAAILGRLNTLHLISADQSVRLSKKIKSKREPEMPVERDTYSPPEDAPASTEPGTKEAPEPRPES